MENFRNETIGDMHIEIALHKVFYNSVWARKGYLSEAVWVADGRGGPGLGKSIPSKPPLVLCHPAIPAVKS